MTLFARFGGLLWLALLLSGPAAQDATAVRIQPGQTEYELRGRMSVFSADADEERTLSRVLSEGNWQPLRDASPNFSFSEQDHWLRLALYNPGPRRERLILDMAQPLQDYIDAWWLVEGDITRQWQTGDRRPLSERPFRYRAFAFPLTLEPGQQGELVLRLRSHDGLYDAVPMHLTTDAEFFKRKDIESLSFGFYYGAITILMLYNLIVGLMTREKDFAVYSLYLLFFLSWNLAFRGYLGITLLADHPTLNNAAVALCSAGIFASLVAFTLGFLNLKTQMPRLHKALWLTSALLVIPVVQALLGYYAQTFAVLIPLAGALLVMILAAAVYEAVQGSVVARIFLLAWGVLIVAVFAYYGRVYGWVPSTWLTENALNLGSLIEILVLSLALAYRINELKRKDLHNQSQLIEHKEQLNTELQKRVEEKTSELQTLAERLERESITDALTGLLNRRTFYPKLEGELRRLQREPTQTLCLALLDLDHFKALNDHYGHPAGDQLLVEVGQLLREQWQRSGDAVFRLGGEEFAILFYTRNLHTVEERLEAFKQALKSIPLPGTPPPHKGVPRVLTASLGVSLVSALYSLSPNEIYGMADRALYAGKERGRDCIHYCSASDRTPRPTLERP